ncbi:MAG: thiolase family protein [Actinobacteria bacterium]|nr:MAG: thiolase family protein [Actinomycetota bacterium]
MPGGNRDNGSGSATTGASGRRVAIVSCAQSTYEYPKDSSREMMVFDVVHELLRKAGITKRDVDTVISAQNDFLEGRTISNMRTVGPLAAYLKDESKVEMDGAWALLYACARILSGNHDIAIVAGESMASCYPPYLPAIWALDTTFDRPLGLLNEITAAALQAGHYLRSGSASAEQVAGVAAKNLDNASRNSHALRRMPGATAADVLSSRMLSSPLHELEAFPLTDGCCALLLACEEKAAAITGKPVWISGVGGASDTYFLGDRDLAASPSMHQAASKAYAAAGITDPARELDLCELTECFAHEELIFYEALGLCPRGKGGEYFASGATRMDGDLPVNPSGGALAANPVCATGLARVAEAALQLRGEAGEHQLSKDVHTALAHGQNGLCAQHNMVFILRSSEAEGVRA